jgi:hypothetical protein
VRAAWATSSGKEKAIWSPFTWPKRAIPMTDNRHRPAHRANPRPVHRA